MAFTILIVCCGTLFSMQSFPVRSSSAGLLPGVLAALLIGSLALFALSALVSIQIYGRKK